MDDNPEIRDRLNVNKSTYHNKRPRERFICFIRGAKWMKINQLNGPSPIHDTSTWLSQSIQSIRHVCCWLGMQKNLPWKCFGTAFRHYDLPSVTVSKLVSLTHAQTLPLGVIEGQHSLTSVERPSYLRSDFVNVWRQAQVKYVIHLHFDRLYPTCLIFGERVCLTFSITPRLIPIKSNKTMPLPSFKGCFDVSSLFLLRGEKDLSVDVTE